MATTNSDDAYLLNSERELDRLRVNHRLYKTAQEGKLILAPLDLTSSSFPQGLKILDSATADGTWLRDAASTLPDDLRQNSTFVGADLLESYIAKGRDHAASSKEGGKFEYFAQDINKDWPADLQNTFDLVHSRFGLVGAAAAGPGGIPKAIARLVGLVKPGGYIQLLEAENIVGEDDGPAMKEFLALIKGVFGCLGISPMFAREGLMEETLKGLGVVDVQTRVIDGWFGEKSLFGEDDAKWMDEMAWSMGVAVVGLVAVVKSFPAIPDGLDPSSLATLHTRIEEEVKQKGGNYPAHIVWGRKPES